MRRAASRYVCQACGHETARWVGRCPDCGEWNSLVEEACEAPTRTPGRQSAGTVVTPVTAVSLEDAGRLSTGSPELDRVLGGGLVPGAVVLVGGDPGIGKSTLLTQTAARLGRSTPVLYVTGEESPQQVRLRAERLSALTDSFLLAAETDIDAVESAVRKHRPACAIIDSIQTVSCADVSSAPGTVSQVRACGERILRLAKSLGVSVFLVGHVTKEGAIAGPRVLEHMVDAVLYFEGERFQSYRVLRAVKNRFGSTDEIGVFEMTGSGLREVSSASELFLQQRSGDEPGNAVAVVMEGTRPLLVEVQALVSRSYLSMPRRATTGVDPNRLAMLLAVLERRCGVRLGECDVYVNVAGGLRVSEPALDLAVVLAVASSRLGRPVPSGLAAAGEVGLSGEIRAVSQPDRRAREAHRMGFGRLLLADSDGVSFRQAGFSLTTGAHLRDVMREVLGPDAKPAGDDPFA